MLWTSFSLGGTLAAGKLHALRQLAENVCDIQWDANVVDDRIEDAVESKRPVTFEGETDDSHNFRDDLIAFCRENALPFSCVWTYPEADPECRAITYWRPGMPAPLELPCNGDGTPSLALGDLMRRADKGMTLIQVIAELSAAQSEHVPALVLVPAINSVWEG